MERILFSREDTELFLGKRLYGEDYDHRNPDHYGIILNTGILTVEEEHDIIVAAIRAFV